MENLYNAVVSFKGDNSFTFYLPNYGELTIYNGKNIFIKGLTTTGVETLRELRPLLLEHKLNGKPDGCYKVIDLTKTNSFQIPKTVEKPEPVKSLADLKAEMIKTEGPIEETTEEIVINKEDILSEEEIKNLSEDEVITVEAKEVTIEDNEPKVEEKPSIENKITKIIRRGGSKKGGSKKGGSKKGSKLSK